EAAATYAEVLYYEHFGRPGQDVGMLTSFHYQLRFMDDPNLPIGLALASYPSEYDYGVYVYLKGALFFDALRMRLGDQDFFDFLKAYFTQTRYGFASAELFEQVAEEVCECNLDELFDLWVYQGGEIPGQ
ncbi:MAG: M1 family aminopeptidase, partial [Anaerolineales bacterium]